MLKKIALIVVVLIGLVLAFAETRPDALHVERSTTINAPAAKIYPLIDDFHQWSAWSPYEARDPAMKKTYSGATKDTGAVYEWAGNSQVGKGRMEITDTEQPLRVEITLDFTAPLAGHDIAVFTLVPHGDSTDVKWTMDGATPYIGKLVGLFMNMDSMIGTDFETGLAKLKTVAEKNQS